MEYLTSWANEGAYQAAKSGLHRPHVSLVKDSGILHYLKMFKFNPRYLWSDGTTSLDIVSGKTAIGIEVAPASAMENGKARFMSVKNMSRSNPEAGSVETGNESTNSAAMIPWGKYNDQVSGLDNLSTPKGLVIGNETPDTTSDNPWGVSYELSDGTATRLVSDYQLGKSRFPDFDANDLYTLINGYYFPVDVELDEDDKPKPWLKETIDFVMTEDGEINPLYSQPSQNPRVCTNDFDGKENTAILVNRIAVSDWETGDLKTDVSSAINHPAAAACYRFNPASSGTAHQWYLPAAGELGFMYANINKINVKLAALGSSNAVPVGMGLYDNEYHTAYPTNTLGYWLWSSSQNAAYNAWNLGTSEGDLYYNNKNYANENNRVRAFLQL